MREVTQWTRETLAGRRKADEPSHENFAPETMRCSTRAVRANRRLLVGRGGRPRLIESNDDFAGKRAVARLFVSSANEASPGASTPGGRQGSPDVRLLRRARRRAKALATANRRKDEFLATLSHELRSPLASIQNAVHLLSAHVAETPALQGTQGLIERQVRRMTRLVDDLLDVSRISQGRLGLRCERIDLRLVVSNAIETLQSDIKERNHHLTIALPDVPVWLQGDPWRLEQVFVNLLANASKYSDKGGELAVLSHTRDGQAVVRIRDSGMGIAPEALPYIFDLFRQTREATARSPSGLGIGLALVRYLVESHGGRVTAASAGLGRGSEFTVRLPRADEVVTGDHIHS